MMRRLLTNRFFLIISASFLVVTSAIIWFFFPSLLKTFNDNRVTADTLAKQIKASQIERERGKELVAAKATVALLYDRATAALPGSPSADLLLLQLDGLTKSLGLVATVTVPFSEGSLSSQMSAPAAPTNKNEIKPGSGSTGGTQPIITSSGIGTNTVFSINGNWDYPTALNLLAKLKTLSRWNTVTRIDLTRMADKIAVTIGGEVFWKPDGNLRFSGSTKELLTQAKTLFEGYQSYATVPDITREGSFGRTNPFQ